MYWTKDRCLKPKDAHNTFIRQRVDNYGRRRALGFKNVIHKIRHNFYAVIRVLYWLYQWIILYIRYVVRSLWNYRNIRYSGLRRGRSLGCVLQTELSVFLFPVFLPIYLAYVYYLSLNHPMTSPNAALEYNCPILQTTKRGLRLQNNLLIVMHEVSLLILEWLVAVEGDRIDGVIFGTLLQEREWRQVTSSVILSRSDIAHWVWLAALLSTPPASR